MPVRKAKAPAGTGASQQTSRYCDRHHHSRPERRRQHSRTLDDFVLDEAEMSPFGPADLVAAGAGAADLTDRVIELVGRAVGRRVRRSRQWEHARQLALRLVVTLWRAGTAGPEDEDTTARIASQALARRLLAEVEAAGAEVVAVLAAVVLAVVLASTPATTPATCRGSTRRRRRRRRAAATCSRARAARKGAGRDARPHAPSRMG